MKQQKGNDNYFLDIDLIDYMKVCEERGRVTRHSLIKHESTKPGLPTQSKLYPQKQTTGPSASYQHKPKPVKPSGMVGIKELNPEKQKRKGRPRKPKEEIKMVEEHRQQTLSVVSSSSSSSSSELLSESSISIKKEKLKLSSSSEEEFCFEEAGKKKKDDESNEGNQHELKKEVKALFKIHKLKKEDSTQKVPNVTTRLQLQNSQTVQPPGQQQLLESQKVKKVPLKSIVKKKVKTNENSEHEKTYESEIKQDLPQEFLTLDIQLRDNLFRILNDSEFYVKDFMQFPIKHLKLRTIKMFQPAEKSNQFIVRNAKIKKQYKRIQNKLEVEYFGQQNQNASENLSILSTTSDPMLIVQETAFLQINEWKFKKIWQNSLKEGLK